jgi:DNA repair photolyase
MSSFQTRISGTKEWSVESVNCVLGCPHRCRYCYAAARAVKFGQCPNREAWGTSYHKLRSSEVCKRRRKIDGRVMFPTTHDITPQFLNPCIELLENLLRAGNEVLIVSKPHLDCVKALCSRLAFYREAVLFRFSIGAMDDSILSYWEPGAPSFAERLACLQYAHNAGYATSVSCEPLLQASNARGLFDALAPYVTDTIWIGKANQIRVRCAPGTDPSEIARIESGQTDQAVREVYGQLRDEFKVRWKESYKQVLGLDLAIIPGQDV